VRPRAALELLLIKRAAHDADPWSGHIALPGGRRAASDVDLFATAARETEEEIGVPLGRSGMRLGALDEITPRSPRLPPLIIAPFVVAVPVDTNVVPDTREVEAAMWIPLDALRQPGAVSEFVMQVEENALSFPSLLYDGHVIWGLTHRILTQFLEVAADAGV
jgi:8-oxo-dGTP pyrophosphatase MutT (NUDIX family)